MPEILRSASVVIWEWPGHLGSYLSSIGYTDCSDGGHLGTVLSGASQMRSHLERSTERGKAFVSPCESYSIQSTRGLQFPEDHTFVAELSIKIDATLSPPILSMLC